MLGCMDYVINLIANAAIRLLGTFDHHLTQNIQENVILMSTDVVLADQDRETENGYIFNECLGSFLYMT